MFVGIFLIREKFSQEALTDREKQSLPSPTTLTSQSVDSPDQISQQSPPEEFNLDVPFTSQAPTGNWDHQHEENCEEASLLMANRFFNNREITSTDDAEKGMAEIVTWENANLGVSDSITAEQTAQVAREFLSLKAEIIKNPTTDQIKQLIFENKLVIVPATGRELGNPFYTSPGPLYHMLVIKGYTQSKFITNDPGTRRGANYAYDYETILNANRDWNGGDVARGQSLMIVVSK